MRRRLDLSVTLLLYLACYVSVMGWENDLWPLISSYEDVGITVDDLILFLATHGFDAHPHKSHVTVKFPNGTVANLTPTAPNQGSPTCG